MRTPLMMEFKENKEKYKLKQRENLYGLLPVYEDSSVHHYINTMFISFPELRVIYDTSMDLLHSIILYWARIDFVNRVEKLRNCALVSIRNFVINVVRRLNMERWRRCVSQ